MRLSDTQLQKTLNSILFSLQRAQNRRVTYAYLAEQIGVSHRTLAEWMRGACEPAAMEAILALLSMLPNEDIVRVIDVWRKAALSRPNAPPSETRNKQRSARLAGSKTNRRSLTRPKN